MNFFLKFVGDNDILWWVLLDGVIDFIVMDYVFYILVEKGKGYLNIFLGMFGVEIFLFLMLI